MDTRERRRKGAAATDLSMPQKDQNGVADANVIEDGASGGCKASAGVNEATMLTQVTTGTFATLLGKRDSEQLHDDHNEDTEEEDTSKLLPTGDEQTLVQCVGMHQSYDSWEAFHRAMDLYCATTFQPMRLRTSDSAKAMNSRAAKRNSMKVPIDESVGFVKKLYVCTHGVKAKPRGKGKRPRQHYRYLGCPAMLRACISERKDDEEPGKGKYIVRVVAQINRHNHRLSDHLFKSYSDSRVVLDDDLQGRPKDEAGSASVVPVEQQLPAAVHPELEDPVLKTNSSLLQPQALDVMNTSRVKYRVGWIGTGTMGASMCGHILNHGYEVTVYNRTISKCDALQENGARVAGSPAEVAQNSDIVFIIVGNPSDVKAVVLDPDTGLLSRMRTGGIIVDMTTSSPALAKKMYEAAKLKGVSMLDAPVSGDDVGARDGTLSVTVGGDVDTVYAMMPFFSILGKNIRHMGPAGAGQHTKLMNQILIATNMIGIVESLLYGKKSGVDMEEAIRVMSIGAAGPWRIGNLGPRIVKRDFEPGLLVEHFVKDMGIALKEAKRMNLSLPGLALANELYTAVKAQGHGRLGMPALMLALEQLNGIYPEKTDNAEEV